jgi:TetR/AcrR family transcriptional regulator, transcriptional repressor for nem operon
MDTREKILDSASRLIQTRSFHGFSFQDIAEEVGIRKASLYHHFDSKDAVAIAVLKRAAGWVSSQLEEAAELEPSARLERYFDMFRVIHHKGERMCPGGSFGAVFDAVSRPVQRVLHDFGDVHLDWLENLVREGVKQGQFSISTQSPRDVAVQIFATVQGALLTARLTSNPHVLDAAVAQLRSYLGYAPPQGTHRPSKHHQLRHRH